MPHILQIASFQFTPIAAARLTVFLGLGGVIGAILGCFVLM